MKPVGSATVKYLNPIYVVVFKTKPPRKKKKKKKKNLLWCPSSVSSAAGQSKEHLPDVKVRHAGAIGEHEPLATTHVVLVCHQWQGACHSPFYHASRYMLINYKKLQEID